MSRKRRLFRQMLCVLLSAIMIFSNFSWVGMGGYANAYADETSLPVMEMSAGLETNLEVPELSPEDSHEAALEAMLEVVRGTVEEDSPMTVQADSIVTTWPTASSIYVGQTIGWGAKLSGGESLAPGAFAFAQPGARPGVGTYNASVVFVPEDTESYSLEYGNASIVVLPVGPIQISEDRLAVVADAQINVAPGGLAMANTGANPAVVAVGKSCGHCDGAYDEYSCDLPGTPPEELKCPDQWGFCSCNGLQAIPPTVSIIQAGDPDIATVSLEDGVLTVAGISEGVTSVVLQAQFKGIDQGTQLPPGSVLITAQPMVSVPKTITIVVGVDSNPAPVISSLAPAGGVIAGGTEVVITGSGFNQATNVKFGETDAAGFVVDSDTQITAVAPACVITDTITDKNNRTYPAPAQKAGVSVITDSGVSIDTAASSYLYYTLTVTIGGLTKTYSLADLQAKPAITGKGGRHGHGDDEGMHHETSTYTGTSVFDLMLEAGGIPEGYNVSVGTADGFRGNLTYNQARYGDFLFMDHMGKEITTTPKPQAQALLVYDCEGQPLAATEGPVRVGIIGDDGQITTGNLWSMWVTSLSVAPPAQPVVTGLSPATGPVGGGTEVTITGLDLSYATAVKFGDANAADYTIVSNTEITAVAPAGAVGKVYVLVTTPGGSSLEETASEYTYTEESEPTLRLVGYRLWDANYDYSQTPPAEITGTLDETVLGSGSGNFIWYAALTFDGPIAISSAEDVLDQINLNGVLLSGNKDTTVYIDPDDPATLIIRAQDNPASTSAQAYSRTTISPKNESRFVPAITSANDPNEAAYFTFDIDSISSTGMKFKLVDRTIGTAETPASVTYELASLSLIRCANQIKFMVNGEQIGSNLAVHTHSPWSIGPATLINTVKTVFNNNSYISEGYSIDIDTEAGTLTISAKEAADGEILGLEMDQWPTSGAGDRRYDLWKAIASSDAADEVKQQALTLIYNPVSSAAAIAQAIVELIGSDEPPITEPAILASLSVPTLDREQTTLDARSNEPLIVDLSEIGLTALDTEGNAYDLSGKDIVWIAETQNAGGTPYTGLADAKIEDGKLIISSTGRVYLTAALGDVKSNYRSITIGINSYEVVLIVDGETLTTITSEELEALSTTGTIRNYSYQSHGGTTDSYQAGYGPTLADIIKTYTGKDQDKVVSVRFNATDNYNTNFADAQASLFNARYCFLTEDDPGELVEPMLA